MALLGSIILIPGGSMPYIDALFFASGSATQSGLNTYVLKMLDIRDGTDPVTGLT